MGCGVSKTTPLPDPSQQDVKKKMSAPEILPPPILVKRGESGDSPSDIGSNNDRRKSKSLRRKSVMFESDMKVITFQNGDVYKGQVQGEMRHGFGIFIWADMDRYEGDWYNNEKHGHGVFQWNNTDRYEGDYKNGLRHGMGTYRYATGDEYVGLWTEDMRSGHGVFKEACGNCYDGEWLNDRRHGKGVFTWHQKGEEVYDGEWQDDMRHGFGTQRYGEPARSGSLPETGSGGVYTGHWKHGKKDGTGRFVYPNGSVFEGDYQQDRRINGVFKYANGDVYTGAFKEGLAHGRGTMTFAVGPVASYTGEWEGSKRDRKSEQHGHGVEVMCDGTRWEGQFINGQRSGQGTTFTSSNSIPEMNTVPTV